MSVIENKNNIMLTNTKNPFWKLIFKLDGLNRSVRRYFIRISSEPRPDSYPYISGDGFRKIADYLYEIENAFESEKIKEGEIVFVQSSLLDHFFANIHPKINCKYKLITHNGDINITKKYLPYIDEKIIKWFAQNVEVEHEKLIPIPIGLENLFYQTNGVISMYNKLRKRKVKKKDKIFYAFNDGNNYSERNPLLKFLADLKIAETISNRMVTRFYLRQLNKYKFIISPPGNGLDCHRTWEAMYLKTLPIVKKTPATEYFFKLGLPIILVKDWSELVEYDSVKLIVEYKKNINRFEDEVLYMPYWLNLIKKKTN